MIKNKIPFTFSFSFFNSKARKLTASCHYPWKRTMNKFQKKKKEKEIITFYHVSSRDNYIIRRVNIFVSTASAVFAFGNVTRPVQAVLKRQRIANPWIRRRFNERTRDSRFLRIPQILPFLFYHRNCECFFRIFTTSESGRVAYTLDRVNRIWHVSRLDRWRAHTSRLSLPRWFVFIHRAGRGNLFVPTRSSRYRGYLVVICNEVVGRSLSLSFFFFFFIRHFSLFSAKKPYTAREITKLTPSQSSSNSLMKVMWVVRMALENFLLI